MGPDSLRRALAVAIAVMLVGAIVAAANRQAPDSPHVRTASTDGANTAAAVATDDASSEAPVATGSGTESPPGAVGGRGGSSAKSPVVTSATRRIDGMADHPGSTGGTLSIGIGWLDINSFTALGSAFGASFATTCGSRCTTKDYAQLVVEYMNAHGGIAGRAIEPIYHEFPAEAALDPQARRQAEQEMCADFTEDHHVFAMIPWVSGEGVIVECAKQADAPMVAIGDFEASVDAQRCAEICRWWYRPASFSAETRERAMVARLLAQGFFERGARVGIMVEDKPVYRRGVTGTLRPALAAAGVDVVTEIDYPDTIQSPWSNYILQLQAAGVTHVVWAHCGCGGAESSLFMRAADQQGWQPRYALGTDNSLNTVASLAPPAQLQNVTGIGWNPFFDRGSGATDPPLTAPDALCREIADDGSKVGYAHPYCEALFFLKAALDRAPELSSAALASAAEGLGSSYTPVGTPLARFAPGRHAGAAAVFDIAFDGPCGCFTYASGPHPVD